MFPYDSIQNKLESEVVAAVDNVVGVGVDKTAQAAKYTLHKLTPAYAHDFVDDYVDKTSDAAQAQITQKVTAAGIDLGRKFVLAPAVEYANEHQVVQRTKQVLRQGQETINVVANRAAGKVLRGGKVTFAQGKPWAQSAAHAHEFAFDMAAHLEAGGAMEEAATAWNSGQLFRHDQSIKRGSAPDLQLRSEFGMLDAELSTSTTLVFQKEGEVSVLTRGSRLPDGAKGPFGAEHIQAVGANATKSSTKAFAGRDLPTYRRVLQKYGKIDYGYGYSAGSMGIVEGVNEGIIGQGRHINPFIRRSQMSHGAHEVVSNEYDFYQLLNATSTPHPNSLVDEVVLEGELAWRNLNPVQRATLSHEYYNIRDGERTMTELDHQMEFMRNMQAQQELQQLHAYKAHVEEGSAFTDAVNDLEHNAEANLRRIHNGSSEVRAWRMAGGTFTNSEASRFNLQEQPGGARAETIERPPPQERVLKPEEEVNFLTKPPEERLNTLGSMAKQHDAAKFALSQPAEEGLTLAEHTQQVLKGVADGVKNKVVGAATKLSAVQMRDVPGGIKSGLAAIKKPAARIGAGVAVSLAAVKAAESMGVENEFAQTAIGGVAGGVADMAFMRFVMKCATSAVLSDGIPWLVGGTGGWMFGEFMGEELGWTEGATTAAAATASILDATLVGIALADFWNPAGWLAMAALTVQGVGAAGIKLQEEAERAHSAEDRAEALRQARRTFAEKMTQQFGLERDADGTASFDVVQHFITKTQQDDQRIAHKAADIEQAQIRETKVEEKAKKLKKHAGVREFHKTVEEVATLAQVQKADLAKGHLTPGSDEYKEALAAARAAAQPQVDLFQRPQPTPLVPSAETQDHFGRERQQPRVDLFQRPQPTPLVPSAGTQDHFGRGNGTVGRLPFHAFTSDTYGGLKASQRRTTQKNFQSSESKDDQMQSLYGLGPLPNP